MITEIVYNNSHNQSLHTVTYIQCGIYVNCRNAEKISIITEYICNGDLSVYLIEPWASCTLCKGRSCDTAEFPPLGTKSIAFYQLQIRNMIAICMHAHI